MKLTRGIALCALTLAIALAIGAVSPYQPYASAGSNSAPEHAPVPTPALATAAPLVEQLPAPTPQVIYIQLPAAPPPQVVFVESPAAAPVEAQQVEAQQVEAQQVEAQQVEAQQVEAQQVDYQQRRLEAIKSGAAYRPRTR